MRILFNILKVAILLLTLTVFSSCREDCYPNVEQFFVAHFKKGGKVVDPAYDMVYSPGGKGNIPKQVTNYNDVFYSLPIPLGSSKVIYYFIKSSAKDSLCISFDRKVEFQSTECGCTVIYSQPIVVFSSFASVQVKIDYDSQYASEDEYTITVNL